MSLFKAREWWSTSCGEDDGFDQASLCVSSLGKGGSDLIFVGSHAGIVRVFCPSLPDAGHAPGFDPKDLLIETRLSNPILELQVGRFISGSQQFHLAILHPHSVCVYSLVMRAGNADHGGQSALVFAYEHHLKKSAYSLVTGPFGGVGGRDFLCVQSLDGKLSFYEQETFVFTRQLPDFLLPGPIIFVASTDAFVTCNSHFNVESYRYQTLAEASDGSDKQVCAEWSLNIGESAINIVSISHSATEVDIFVLGEHNLFCIRDHGTLKLMRRFEFHPRCFHVFRTAPEGLTMVLLSTDTGTLLVLNNTTLCWSAQLPFSPVAVSRASLQGMEGVVVVLSETGVIQCCYLGTDPCLFVAPSVEPRPIDYQEAEKELNYLSSVVQAFNESSSLLMANTAADRELKVNVKPSQHPETRGNSQVCYVAVDLSPHSAHSPLNKVQVTIAPQAPLIAEPPSHSISSLCEDYQVASYVMLKSSSPECVWSLEVQVMVSYMTETGIPRVIHSSCQLPFQLVASHCPPGKDAEIKVTFDSSVPAVSLLQLFPEFTITDGGPNSLGFSFGSAVVTLSTVKMSTRYRLQSDSVYPLAVLIKQLFRRLERFGKSTDPIRMTAVSALPTQQLFLEIENHLRSRKRVNEIQDDLSQLSIQFRAIQRRLLTKMKDKKPTPLNQLDTLLFATQQEIISGSFLLEGALENLESSQCRLSCAVELFNLMLLSLKVDPAGCASFRAALSPCVTESEDHGWEDWTSAALQYVLKTMHSSSKTNPALASSFILEPISDLSQISKLISQAVSGIMTDSNYLQDDDGKKLISPIHEVAELEEEPTVPMGSSLAENRNLSARTKSKSGLLSAQPSVAQDSQKDSMSFTSSDPVQNSEDDVLWI